MRTCCCVTVASWPLPALDTVQLDARVANQCNLVIFLKRFVQMQHQIFMTGAVATELYATVWWLNTLLVETWRLATPGDTSLMIDDGPSQLAPLELPCHACYEGITSRPPELSGRDLNICRYWWEMMLCRWWMMSLLHLPLASTDLDSTLWNPAPSRPLWRQDLENPQTSRPRLKSLQLSVSDDTL